MTTMNTANPMGTQPTEAELDFALDIKRRLKAGEQVPEADLDRALDVKRRLKAAFPVDPVRAQADQVMGSLGRMAALPQTRDQSQDPQNPYRTIAGAAPSIPAPPPGYIPGQTPALNAEDIPVVGDAMRLYRVSQQTPAEAAFREYNQPKVTGPAAFGTEALRMAGQVATLGVGAPLQGLATGWEATGGPLGGAAGAGISAAMNIARLPGATRLGQAIQRQIGGAAGAVANPLARGAASGVAFGETQAALEGGLRVVPQAAQAADQGAAFDAAFAQALEDEAKSFLAAQPQILTAGAVGGAAGDVATDGAAAAIVGRARERALARVQEVRQAQEFYRGMAGPNGQAVGGAEPVGPLSRPTEVPDQGSQPRAAVTLPEATGVAADVASRSSVPAESQQGAIPTNTMRPSQTLPTSPVPDVLAASESAPAVPEAGTPQSRRVPDASVPAAEPQPDIRPSPTPSRPDLGSSRLNIPEDVVTTARREAVANQEAASGPESPRILTDPGESRPQEAASAPADAQRQIPTPQAEGGRIPDGLPEPRTPELSQPARSAPETTAPREAGPVQETAAQSRERGAAPAEVATAQSELGRSSPNPTPESGRSWSENAKKGIALTVDRAVNVWKNGIPDSGKTRKDTASVLRESGQDVVYATFRGEWKEGSKTGMKRLNDAAAQAGYSVSEVVPRVEAGNVFDNQFVVVLTKADPSSMTFQGKKKPWQMRSFEYEDAVRPDIAKMMRSQGMGIKDGMVAAAATRRQHREIIQKAIEDGNQVPPEVLADYPDLQSGRVGPPPAEVANPPVKPKGEVGAQTANKPQLSGNQAADKRQAAPQPNTTGFLDSVIAKAEGRKKARAPKSNVPESTDGFGTPASWVIREKATGKVVMETFEQKAVEALNTAKYEAIPIREYLSSLNNPKPSRVEKAADATIAAAEARKAERRKALAEARRNAKPGERPGSSILPDIVDDVVIVAAKAIKAGVRGAKAIRDAVRAHLGTDNEEVATEVSRMLESVSRGDGYDQEMFAREVEKLYGRADLANPATDPAAREFVDMVDAQRNADGKPERRADKTVEQQADERLKADYEGEKRKLIEAAANGTTPTDVDTVIARRVVEDSALKAVKNGDAAAYKEALTIANAYRDQGAEIARAFRQRRDKVMGPEERAEYAKTVLANIITTPSQNVRKRLASLRAQIAAAREAGNGAEVERLQKQVDANLKRAADTATRINERLRATGLDPSTIDGTALQDPDTAARVARVVSSAQSNTFDRVHEFWINSILSGPQTHIANVVGNAGYGFFDLGIGKLAEAGVGKIPGFGSDAPTFGEWVETWRGFMPSLAEAAKNFSRSFATETPAFSDSVRGYSDPSQQAGVKGELQNTRAAIPGKAGRIIRTPGRVLMATDEFFKTIYTKMVMHGEAYRMAKAEGLRGNEARARAADIMRNPSPELWEAGMKEAERLTFQEDDKAISAIGDLKYAFPGLRYIIPFVRTPYNIFKAGLGMSPLGVFGTAARVARRGLIEIRPDAAGGWTYTRRDLARDLAKNLVSIGTAALIYGLVDSDEPWITGSAAKETGKRAAQYRTDPPYSVRIGDSWYSYRRIEPFGTALAATVDGMNAYRKADTTEKKMAALAAFMQGVVQQTGDKTFLKGIGDLMKAIDNQSGVGKEIANMAANFAVSFVPNIIRQPLRAADPIERDQTVRPDDQTGYAKALARNTIRKAIPLGKLPPRMDIWGRTVENRPTGHVASDFLYRLLSPVQKLPADQTLAVDRMLTNWNNKVESEADGVNQPWWPTAPDNIVTVGGKRYRLTEDEYVRYVRNGGQNALKWIGELSEESVRNPKPWTIKHIQNMLEKARSTEAILIVGERGRAAKK